MNGEDGTYKNVLYNSGTTCNFNPPHLSYMGEAFDRRTGIVRRILNSMLVDSAERSLTHDILNTFIFSKNQFKTTHTGIERSRESVNIDHGYVINTEDQIHLHLISA